MLLLGDTQLNQKTFLKEASKDQYYHCLTSDAAKIVSNKWTNIGN